MRKFLVVLDDTKECLNAMRFAAMRASRTGGGVTVLSVIAAGDIQHGLGVAEVMRAEARERIEAHYEVFAKWMRDRHQVFPELVIREGEPANEITALISEDEEIGILVLGASSEKAGPGPIVTYIMRNLGTLPCPVTIVPGDIAKERLERIS